MSTPAPTPRRIFISHSHYDNDWCMQLADALTRAGLVVWFDKRGLYVGAQWVKTIEEEVHRCDIFLIILTPDAWTSEWVQEELSLALGQRKQILDVLLKPTPMTGFITNRQLLDAIGQTAEHAAQQVVAALGLVPAPAHPAPVRPQPAPTVVASPIARERFPQRLEELGFVANKTNNVEYIVPPLCDVPVGPFLMGSDKGTDPQASDAELPQHTVRLPAYQLARYPVTVAEHACFVRATNRAAPISQYNTLTWPQQLEDRLDHPIVNVSWSDAVAYARWLAARTSQPWRLPSEAEWEKAARGTDGRPYPWGAPFDATRCNSRESGKESTTPIGAYPTGASPYGAQDLAGNVWEWTASLYQPYPYNATVGRESGNSTENRVLRGGSWINVAWVARAAYRIHFLPAGRNNVYGFRLVPAVPSSLR